MNYFKLGLVSFIFLFLELALIRLIGTEIRIFAYLSNLVLLAVFIGAGLGMLIRKVNILIAPLFLSIILLLLYNGWFADITSLLAPLSSSFVWYQNNYENISLIFLGVLKTLLLFLFVFLAFVPIGNMFGSFFKSNKNTIVLYSVSIIASLLGMWSFYIFSFLKVNPLLLIVSCQLILLLFLSPNLKSFSTILLVLITLFLGGKTVANYLKNKNTVWSPYQKITLIDQYDSVHKKQNYLLTVNDVSYMALLDLSSRYEIRSQYNLAYKFNKKEPRNILIIGGGGGNDAAGALRNTKQSSIDVVEIDPVIIELGKKYHPEKPYSSKRVNIIIDDGRSFIKRTSKKYDLVVMGLADSHTLNSTLNNVQLDNYLYTQESFGEIKKILNSDGLIVLTFAVQRPWIGGRLKQGLENVFNHPPIIVNLDYSEKYGWGGQMFVASNSMQSLKEHLDRNPKLASFLAENITTYPRISNNLTDDWPYLYLDREKVPAIHLIITAVIIFFVFLLQKKIVTSRFQSGFFLLGAGYLLFEFQNISKTSLLFGNTWTTNLFTISAALLFILAANLVYLFLRPKLIYSFVLLVLSFSLQYIIPLSAFNYFSWGSKSVFGTLIINLPFFASSLIFITLFTQAKNKPGALAYNFIGSALGGIISILSYYTGIKFILSLSFGLYLVAMMLIYYKYKVSRV